MSVRSALVTALLLAAATEPAVRGVELRFAPEPGLALRKSFERVDATKSRGVRSSMAGHEQDFDQRHDTEGKARLVVVDRYVEVDGGRVLALERTYEEFERENHSEFEHEATSMDTDGVATNELDGLTVRFTWNADDEAYVAACNEAEDEWLEQLEADRDYAALLPDGEVDAGDEWTIDAETFQTLTRPLEDLPLDWETEQDGDTVGETIEDEEVAEPDETEEHEELTGEITARFDGMREIDGREFAVIALKGELVSTTRISGSTESEEQGDSSFEHETRAEHEIRGECLWDGAGAHLHALTVEIVVKGEAENRTTFEMLGSTLVWETESELESVSTLEVRFERAE